MQKYSTYESMVGSYHACKSLAKHPELFFGTLRDILEGRPKWATGKFSYRAPETRWRPKMLETTITQLICHLGMKFQRLYLCFYGCTTRWNNNQQEIHDPFACNQDGGYVTGRNLSLLYTNVMVIETVKRQSVQLHLLLMSLIMSSH